MYTFCQTCSIFYFYNYRERDLNVHEFLGAPLIGSVDPGPGIPSFPIFPPSLPLFPPGQLAFNNFSGPQPSLNQGDFLRDVGNPTYAELLSHYQSTQGQRGQGRRQGVAPPPTAPVGLQPGPAAHSRSSVWGVEEDVDEESVVGSHSDDFGDQDSLNPGNYYLSLGFYFAQIVLMFQTVR